MLLRQRLRAFLAVVLCLSSETIAQTPGSLDLSFDTGAAAEGGSDVALGADGKAVVIGGHGYSGKIARLHPDGSFDRSFAVGAAFGQTTDEMPVCVAVQGDGKVIVGGFFRFFDGVFRQGIVRLNADGTVDTAFDPGSLLQRVNDAAVYIRFLALQPDGKIVAAGGFRYTGGDGVSRLNLARFNANGTIDGSFRPDMDLTLGVSALAIGPTGQIVLNYTRNLPEGERVCDTARLLSSGALDTTFDDGAGATQFSVDQGTDYPMEASALAVQADGSVIIGGHFDKVNGLARAGLARLTPTGALDPNFDPAGFRYVFGPQGQQQNWGGTISTLRVVDGKVLVSGSFTHVSSPDGPARGGMARLNGNGALDDTFDVMGGFGPNIPPVTGVAVRSGTGEIVVAGGFSLVGEVKVPGIIQITSSGAVDAAFLANMQQGFDEPTYVVAVQEDGKVLVGGFFNRANGVLRPGLARLNADGSVDASFDTGAGFIGTAADGSQFPAPVLHIGIQRDGKIVVAGSFTSFGGMTRHGLLRLNEDGSLDPTFDPGEGFYYETVRGNILGLALWRDPANPAAPERIVVIGGFTHHVEVGTDENGNPTSTVRSRAAIARLNADGTLDTTFDPGTGFTNPALRNAVMTKLLVQPDGKIVAAGSFTAYNDVPGHTLIRLNADGTRDASFDTRVSFANQGFVETFARSDDGKLLVGGYLAPADPNTFFTTILRLNENGSKDGTFDAGTGFQDVFSGDLNDLVLQANGKILAAGMFSKYRDVNRRSIARLNADGTHDSTFNPGVGFGGTGQVSDIALQADGKIIAAGSFNRFDGTVRHYLARIHGGVGGGGGDPEESDLRLTATGSSAVDPTGQTTRPGELITYTLNYANVSGSPVTDVVITATIPAATNFKPASPRDGSRLVTRKVNGVSVKAVEWKIGALNANAGGTVSFSVLVSKKAVVGTEIEFNRAEITGKRNGAPLPPDGANRVNMEVKNLLDVSSTTVTSEAGPGGLIIYRFAVRNDGSAPLRDVRLNYQVQTGSAVVSAFFADANGVEIGSPVKAPGKLFNPSVDERGELVTWFFGTVPAHTTRYAKLTVRLWYDRLVDQPLVGGDLVGTFRNPRALNTAPRVIPATVAPSGGVAVERPYLGLSKSVDEVTLVTDSTVGEVAATTVGDRFTFTLFYYNLGERTAERVFIQERAPENTVIDPRSVRINDAEPSTSVTVTDKGRTLVARLGNVAPGGIGKLTYRVRVLPRQDRAINHFLVSEGGYIGSASLSETVHAYPDPLLVKVVAPVSFSPFTQERPSRAGVGEVVQHFIHFRNNGAVPAKNARITNPIPAGAKFHGASWASFVNGEYADIGAAPSGGGSIVGPELGATSGDILFRLGNLAAGETVIVRVALEMTPEVLALTPPRLVNAPRIDYGPERTGLRQLLAAGAEDSGALLAPNRVGLAFTGVIDPSVPRFFLGMMAPATVREGERFTYLGFYGNTGDTAAVATIRLHVPPATAQLEIVNLTTDRVDPDAFANHDAEGNVVITARIPPHTQLPFQLVYRAIAAGGGVVLASDQRISGAAFPEVRSSTPLATYIYSGAAFDEAAARSSVESAVLNAAGVNFANGRDNSVFKNELRQLGARSISTILVGADYIALINGAFAIPLGGDQVLVGAAGIVSNDGATIISRDGAGIVSNDGATIVSNDGATIISGGAGNIRFHGLPGFTGSPTAATLLANPSQIISGGAGNLLNLGGHNLFGGINGTALVNNASGGFANSDNFRLRAGNLVSSSAGSLIGQDSAGIISRGGGNIYVVGAGNIFSGGGGNILGDQGSGIMSSDTSSVTTSAGGNIISGGGGNIISGGAGN